MGLQEIEGAHSPQAIRTFTRSLLRDLQALRRMVDEGMIEVGQRRFGAEQELFLVDQGWRPAPLAVEVLERLPQGGAFTTELARFNLEFNLDPQVLGGDCFSRLQLEIEARLEEVRVAAHEVGAEVVLTGILPTLGKSDLSMANITPRPRYHQLNDAMNRIRGGTGYRLRIIGADEINIEHDSVMLESCNTSAQIHMQVEAGNFAAYYNASQALIGPVLAAAVNSPLLFGKRLWAETRIALFQQSLDTRSASVHMRDLSPRVRFGEHWVKDSVLELFEEDVARFRVLLAGEVGEDPLLALDEGRIPALKALQLHNSTVYRWNRPCYGVGGGKPHLRIECRAIPAGPSVVDEVANAAFWIGAVTGLYNTYGDVSERLDFDAAKSNFLAASRLGLRAGFQWIDGESISARSLVLEQILPLAREGLEELGVDAADIDRYLGIVRERVVTKITGSEWLRKSLAGMGAQGTVSQRLAAITAGTATRQQEGRPVHEWSLARLEEAGEWTPNFRTVEQYMTTSLFTVQEDELLDLVAFMMDRKQIRHVLVEDEDNNLVGIVSYRSLLRLVAEGKNAVTDPQPVSAVMHRNPITVSPRTPTLEAIDLMREHGVTCLPVVSAGKLVGIVTQTDYMPIAYQLLTERLRADGDLEAVPE